MDATTRMGWIVVLGMIGAAGCAETNQALRVKNRVQAMRITELSKDTEGLRKQLRALEEHSASQQQEVGSLTQERDSLRDQLANLEQQRAGAAAAHQELKAKLAALLKPHDCEVVSRGEHIVIRARMGFIPGGIEPDKDGQKRLSAIAEALRKAAPGGSLRIEGHTDDTAIRESQYPSNWELSGARAAHVLRFLVDRCGLSSERLCFAGYGEHAPLVPNLDVKSRARNRRIEIVLLAAR